jgi:hypothetical protein
MHRRLVYGIVTLARGYVDLRLAPSLAAGLFYADFVDFFGRRTQRTPEPLSMPPAEISAGAMSVRALS